MKTISFAGSMLDCCPRMLWQALFDIYREHKGDLSNMDNMLLDYRNCVELLGRFPLEDADCVEFLFCMEPGHWVTSWKESHSWAELGLGEFLKWQDWSVVVLVTVTNQIASFSMQKP